MLEVRSVSFDYPNGVPVFRDFSWTVNAGEAWAILGPSGCGKSTLLSLIAGLLRPSQGEVRVEGDPVVRPRPRTGLVLQDFGLLPWATCEQNVSLGLRIRGFYGPDGTHAPRGRPAGDARGIAERWLRRLDLDRVRHHYPAQLSGGQRQRAAIARTLALEPDLLLMDEPFASLDAPTREGLQDLTLELRAEQRLTTLVVTHAIEEAAVLGEKILVMGPSRVVIENPQAGAPGHRASESFHSVCRLLRERMGNGSPAPLARPS